MKYSPVYVLLHYQLQSLHFQRIVLTLGHWYNNLLRCWLLHTFSKLTVLVSSHCEPVWQLLLSLLFPLPHSHLAPFNSSLFCLSGSILLSWWVTLISIFLFYKLQHFPATSKWMDVKTSRFVLHVSSFIWSLLQAAGEWHRLGDFMSLFLPRLPAILHSRRLLRCKDQGLKGTFIYFCFIRYYTMESEGESQQWMEVRSIIRTRKCKNPWWEEGFSDI